MSVEAVEWVWKHSKSKGCARHVLVTIAICAGDTGTCDTMSLKFLREATQVTQRHLIRVIQELKNLRELDVQIAQNQRDRIYRVNQLVSKQFVSVTPRTNKTFYSQRQSELYKEARTGRGPNLDRKEGAAVKKEYLEFIRLRNEGKMPKPMTWNKWQKLTEPEREKIKAA